jgi:hypothetical protein
VLISCAFENYGDILPKTLQAATPNWVTFQHLPAPSTTFQDLPYTFRTPSENDVVGMMGDGGKEWWSDGVREAMECIEIVRVLHNMLCIKTL